MRHLLLAVLALAGLGPLTAASAAEVEEAILGTCISQFIMPGPELASGISTGNLARDAVLLHCNGEPVVLAAPEGKIELKQAVFNLKPPEPGPATRTPSFSVSELRATPIDPRNQVSCTEDMPYDARPSIFKGAILASLVGKTNRYPHDILGDPIEATGFCTLDLWSGEAATLSLPPGSVFEDLRVRLVDLTGDGQAEFVVIRSYLDHGAALAVYRLVEGRIEHLTETPPIGRPNRWLNPAGAADFDGDGRVEIAYVETPHIGGTLRLWELRDGRLHQEQAVAGFSNHAIGSRELDLSAVLDWNADGIPDLAVPANGRRSLRIVTFAGGDFAELDAIPHDAEIVTAILATDLDTDGKPELLYGLEDGRLMVARP